MTEGSPHTLILSSSSKLPVGCPGARGEGYRATHQNTGACCWHGNLKCMEGDHETTEIDTLPDKESQQG